MVLKPKRPKRRAGGKPPDDGSAFKGVGSHIQYSIAELMPNLIATACRIGDAEQGREQLTQLINAAFQAKFGEAMTVLEKRLERLQAELKVTLEQLSDARSIDVVTPQYLAASKINHGRNADEHEETDWAYWPMRHKVESGLIGIFLPAALAASAITAHSNLVGTGLPIFLENPVLPLSMAMLAPMASISIKTMWHSLRSENSRAAFTRILNGTALGLILVWSGLFADQFHGLGSSISGGLFDEPSLWGNAKETGFTAATLLTEMVLGAVLAHRLDKIAASYSPNFWIRNPDSEAIQAHIVELEAKSEVQSELDAELTGKLTEFTASLNLQVVTATLSYDGKRAVFDQDTF